MAAQSLQYVIKAQLDDASIKGLTKQLKSSVNDGIIKNLQNQLSVVEEAIKRSKSTKDIRAFTDTKIKLQDKISEASAPSLGTAIKGEASSFASMFKPMNLLTGLVGKIAGGVSVIAILAEALEPAIKIVEKVLKLAGELLRPIGDLITALIRPLFGMLMPIVRIMNTMMMPFRQAANMLSSSAMQDLAKGFTSGDGGLIAKGVTKSLLAGMTIFNGFIIAIEKIGFILVKAVITGMYQLSIAVFYRPFIIAVSSVLAAMPFGLGEASSKRFAGIGATFLSGGEATLENVFSMIEGVIDTQSEVVLAQVRGQAELLGLDMSSVIKKTIYDIDFIGPFETFAYTQVELVKEVYKDVASMLAGDYDEAWKDQDIVTIFDDTKKSMTEKYVGLVKDSWADAKIKIEAEAALAKANIDSAVASLMPETSEKTYGPIANESIWAGLASGKTSEQYSASSSSSLNSTVKSWFDKSSSESIPALVTKGGASMSSAFSSIFSMSTETSLPAILKAGTTTLAATTTTAFTPANGTITKPFKDGLASMNREVLLWTDAANKSTNAMQKSCNTIESVYTKLINAQNKLASYEKNTGKR